jgi:hypothetical protein
LRTKIKVRKRSFCFSVFAAPFFFSPSIAVGEKEPVTQLLKTLSTVTRTGLIARRITHDSEALIDKLKLAAAAIPKDPNTMGA